VTPETAIIALVRIAGALPVLRWPLAGAIIAIVVDLSDLLLAYYLDYGGIPNYQAFDKLADLAYMATFLIVALRWDGLARSVALALFVVRLLGVLAFEVTGARSTLLLFPNVFELWFLFVATRNRIAPEYEFTPRRTAPILAALAGLKLSQEYLLHIDRRLDSISVPEAAEMVRSMLQGLLPH
jgi:hypothetical protein